MLSRTAEYAVRAALWLAANTRQPRTVQQIARGIAVPAGYLAKILQALGRAGLVTAQPGPGGGFILNRAPSDIALLTVIDAVDPILRIQTCPLNIASHARCLCPLHARLDAVQAYLQQSFGTCSLADLLVESGSGVQLFCGAAAEPDTDHKCGQPRRGEYTTTGAAADRPAPAHPRLAAPLDESDGRPASPRYVTKGKQK